jgi:hypothetical protein
MIPALLTGSVVNGPARNAQTTSTYIVLEISRLAGETLGRAESIFAEKEEAVIGLRNRVLQH